MEGNNTWLWTTVIAGGITYLTYKLMQRAKHESRLRFESVDLTQAEIHAKRKQHFCAAQSVSYANTDKGPLVIVKGQGQYLFDAQGQRYLDTRNNVGHVGWQHPDVVGAVSRQLAETNSNTRYLHRNPVLLAEQLLETLPDQLQVCFFVNSGSEANDLAIRLSQAHTGGGDSVVIHRGYHGNTTAVIERSPYKFLTKGGQGKPDHVQVVPCPDTYRGELKTGEEYADCVKDACLRIEQRGSKVSSFFVESGMSVAGVILPPQGYLKQAFKHVRDRGGVCICDEVQVGFGRYGDSFWGFQQQGVVPDIVTMGKPFGNGHPLGAVVCTREIAERFTNGMEYFNTFGGNPVSCAAGLAVLEVVEREGLQEHARRVGIHLRKLLQELMGKDHGRWIGDVRGTGLFVGIEFVKDRITLEPATQETSLIAAELLKDHAMLTSIDGEFDNVMVMKPPMCFNEENATAFVGALECVLRGL